MRIAAFVVASLVILAALPAEGRRLSRNYLAFAAGTDILTGDVSGDVIDSRGNAAGEIGVGHQFNDHWLVEFTYGFLGRYEENQAYRPLPPLDPLPPDIESAFRVSANPLYLRARWTRSGIREEYFKPELSLGLGYMQVTRLLRNYPNFPPFDTSQLLPALELGASALFVFSRNFMGYVGGRFTVTERRGIVDRTNSFDRVGLLFGFRTFLPSPRDVAEPGD